MKSSLIPFVCAILLIITSEVQSYRILALYPFSSKSHKNFAIPILEALAEKGHEVALINPYKTAIKSQNFRDILVNTTMEHLTSSGLIPLDDLFNPKSAGLTNLPLLWADRFETVGKLVFENPEVMQAANEEWDLIIMSAFMNEFMYGMAAKINKPIVQLAAGSLFPWLESSTRNPSHWPFYRTSFMVIGGEDAILQRTLNFVMANVLDYVYDVVYMPAIRKAALPYFGDDVPDYMEVRKNVSLTLTNSHYSIHSSRPHLPNIIEVGGLHCKPAQELPKNLNDFAESSGDEGFIYFSLGSIAQGSKMPERCRLELVRAFSMIPYKVIWKWETEQMEGLPENVLLVKWVPQQDILGHPKLRLFITHGGGMSTQEAIYHGVPRIGFPLFAEQEMNIKDSVKMGIALGLNILDFKAEELARAINRVIDEESFTANSQHLSKVFREQDPPPLDRAVYWIEYVIRHNGAKHLRSVAADMPWYQFHLLDVFAFIAAVVIAVIFAIVVIIKLLCKCFRKCCGKKNIIGKTSTEKNKKE